MISQIVIFAFALVAVANCGVVPAAYISPYASTFNAHTINHAVAAPFVHAPAAKLISSPYVHASPYAAKIVSPYSALPYSSAYSAYPYAAPFASPYSAPYSAYSAFPGSYYL